MTQKIIVTPGKMMKIFKEFLFVLFVVSVAVFIEDLLGSTKQTYLIIGFVLGLFANWKKGALWLSDPEFLSAKYQIPDQNPEELKKFFDTLTEMYLDKGDYGYSVKFYLQESTFSYEIQESDGAFSNTPVIESDVYSFWRYKTEEIIDDIITDLKTLKFKNDEK
jgi:hypothetical protein